APAQYVTERVLDSRLRAEPCPEVARQRAFAGQPIELDASAGIGCTRRNIQAGSADNEIAVGAATLAAIAPGVDPAGAGRGAGHGAAFEVIKSFVSEQIGDLRRCRAGKNRSNRDQRSGDYASFHA